VLPEEGETESQLPALEATDVNVTAAPPDALSWISFVSVAALPAEAVNVSDDGFAEIPVKVGWLTVAVTRMDAAT
jgi:hypothetical protein